MDDKFVQTSFGKLHMMVAGSGEPALLIHGYSTEVSSWRVWEKNIPSLAAHNRAHALDLLGYGDSEKPEPRLDARGEAKALIELIDAERFGRVNLVGLPWGGTIAQIIVGSAPGRVHKLVLVDSGYDGTEKGIARLHKIACPTLIVWDEEDAVIPVAGAELLGREIPNARVRIFKKEERDPGADPNNRHWSQVSHSRLWNQVVNEFLGQED